jgi:eukaryotic-like serine/threonine-protein kinase
VTSPADDPPLPTTDPVLMDRYAVEGILGRGGMGVVFAARSLADQRPVAIKVLERDGAISRGRFEREAKVIRALRSEHITELLETGFHRDLPCIVMERLSGQDFSSLVKERPLALGPVADCVLQTCEALAQAHGAGVVHRDIKASNLFEHVRADGSRIVKVLDFGISKWLGEPLDGAVTLTRTREGGLLGSPRYMSPEQFRNPKAVDGRADLWSVGVVAYRLLSGRFPFAGESSVAVFGAILETTPRSLEELGIGVPAEVDAAIRRCLAKNRDERFASAAEVAAAFAPFATERWRRLPDEIVAITRRSPPINTGADEGDEVGASEPRTITVVPPIEWELGPRRQGTGTERLADAPRPTVGTGTARLASAPLPPMIAEVPETRPTAPAVRVEAPPPPRSGQLRLALIIGAMIVIAGLTGAGLSVLRHPSPTPAAASGR